MGADVLGGCKEPEKHFALVKQHIAGLRSKEAFEYSTVVYALVFGLSAASLCYASLWYG